MDETEIAKLVSESLGGNGKSFEKLLILYEKPVFNAAYRILNNYEDARDATQNALLKAYENLEQFDSGHRFFSWIYRIAINEAINMRAAKHPGVDLDAARRLKETHTPERSLGQAEVDELIQTALMALALEYRVVVVLRHFLDLSYRDIGVILDIPEKTVKSRLFTGRTLLREYLSRKGML